MIRYVLFAVTVGCALGQYKEENYGPPAPYAYNYLTQDPEGTSSHEESTDGSGRVQGKYTMQLADGRMRTVTYWADETGFHADIVTNEQGTESKNPADVTIQSSALPGPEAALAAEPHRAKSKAAASAAHYAYAPAPAYAAAPAYGHYKAAASAKQYAYAPAPAYKNYRTHRRYY